MRFIIAVKHFDYSIGEPAVYCLHIFTEQSLWKACKQICLRYLSLSFTLLLLLLLLWHPCIFFCWSELHLISSMLSDNKTGWIKVPQTRMQKYMKLFFVTCSNADEQKSQKNNSSHHASSGWITESNTEHRVFFIGNGNVCAWVRAWEHSRWN